MLVPAWYPTNSQNLDGESQARVLDFCQAPVTGWQPGFLQMCLILIDKVGSQMCPNLGSWNWVSSWETCRYVFLSDFWWNFQFWKCGTSHLQSHDVWGRRQRPFPVRSWTARPHFTKWDSSLMRLVAAKGLRTKVSRMLCMWREGQKFALICRCVLIESSRSYWVVCFFRIKTNVMGGGIDRRWCCSWHVYRPWTKVSVMLRAQNTMFPFVVASWWFLIVTMRNLCDCDWFWGLWGARRATAAKAYVMSSKLGTQVVFGENNLFSGIYFCFSPCYLPDI